MNLHLSSEVTVKGHANLKERLRNVINNSLCLKMIVIPYD